MQLEMSPLREMRAMDCMGRACSACNHQWFSSSYHALLALLCSLVLKGFCICYNNEKMAQELCFFLFLPSEHHLKECKQARHDRPTSLSLSHHHSFMENANKEGYWPAHSHSFTENLSSMFFRKFPIFFASLVSCTVPRAATPPEPTFLGPV
jgi:hypothetical protein